MQRKFLVRFGLLLTLLALLAACTAAPAAPAASGEQPADTAASDEVVQVHAYINTGALNRKPDGSDPAKLAEVSAIVTEATGVEIVPILPPGGAASIEKLNLMLSSPNERLDLFTGDWTQYRDAVIPLNDLLEEHGQNILQAFPPESWARMSDADGTIWGIPRLVPIATYPVWVRTDVLETLGMEMPQTIEEYEAYMQAYMESDPTAIPLLVGSIRDFRNVLLGAYTEFGNSNWIDPADGLLKPAELQPGFEDWVAKMAEWYADGYIYKDTFGSTDNNRLREVVKGQKVGSAATWYSVITLSMPALIESNADVQYDYVTLTGPAGPAQTINAGGSEGLLITQRAADPAAIIEFINWQYESLDNTLTAMFGVPGTDWNYTDTATGTEALVEGTKLVETGDAAVTGYASEVMWAWGLPTEKLYVVVDAAGNIGQHYAYLNGPITDISVGKQQADAGVSYVQSEIQDIFPNQQDFTRYVEENLTNFINGSRPMSQWGDFVEGLDAVGLDQWVEAYNAQYALRTQE